MKQQILNAAREIKSLLKAQCSEEFIAGLIDYHCGKLHTPDPAQVGIELAEHIFKMHAYQHQAEPAVVQSVLELQWECDFWKEKALNP